MANEALPNNWLFVFKKEQSQGTNSYIYKVQLLDTSENTERYNLFTLIEGTDVTFTRVGDYYYNVYQMPDAISIDETEGELVERGKMRILRESDPIPAHVVSINRVIYDKDIIS